MTIAQNNVSVSLDDEGLQDIKKSQLNIVECNESMLELTRCIEWSDRCSVLPSGVTII